MKLLIELMIEEAEVNRTQIIIGQTWRLASREQIAGGKTKKKNTLVFGNAGIVKNRYPGGRKCIFLINLI